MQGSVGSNRCRIFGGKTKLVVLKGLKIFYRNRTLWKSVKNIPTYAIIIRRNQMITQCAGIQFGVFCFVINNVKYPSICIGAYNLNLRMKVLSKTAQYR